MPDAGFPYEFRPGQRELVSFIETMARECLSPVVEAGTGTGKTVSALAGMLAARGEGSKVIFLTRTNSQQDQAVRESAALGAVCVALRGRRVEDCPTMRDDPDLSDGSSEEISKLCSELRHRGEGEGRCPFYAALDDLDLEPWIELARRNPPPDEFAREAEAAGICPFELRKKLLPYADVVAASYNYLFMDSILRMLQDWTGTSLRDMLVVVDEAHNLPDFLRGLGSNLYPRSATEQVEKEARKEGDIEVCEGLKVSDVAGVVREVIDATVREFIEGRRGESDGEPVDKEDSRIPPEHVRDELMSRLGMTSNALLNAARVLQDYGESIAEERKKRKKLPRSHIGTLGRFLEFWMTEEDDFSVRLVNGGENPSLESYCMDPAPAARPLNGCRSALLMSGTLEPIEDFVREIGLEGASPYRLPSPFPPENLLLLYTDRVTMGYDVRFQEDNYGAMKEIMVSTLDAARVNTGVFFPSHDVRDRMDSEGVFDRGRDVFRERKGMPQGELMRMLDRFRASDGGVLLSVMGGRISEGIDFPGDAMRLAVLVGVPYPRPTEKVKATERYYDMRFGDGWRYVREIPASRKMRQAIGRIIRSETDRGVAVVLDRRVAALNLGAMLCSDVPAAVRAFFDEAGDANP